MYIGTVGPRRDFYIFNVFIYFIDTKVFLLREVCKNQKKNVKYKSLRGHTYFKIFLFSLLTYNKNDYIYIYICVCVCVCVISKQIFYT